MKRKSFTDAQRLKIFLHHGGKCHLCGVKIAHGEDWEVEHDKAKGLQGTDDLENTKPAHIDCHAGKTKKDVAIMRKADRQGKKHLGLTRPRKKIQSRPFARSDRRKALYLRGVEE
jgi:5-methylcytosine-specific restriction endonuclease McrA